VINLITLLIQKTSQSLFLSIGDLRKMNENFADQMRLKPQADDTLF
jgi:hypothetical protein